MEGLRQQASDALARYEAAVRAVAGPPRFVPVGELTRQIGDWEPANGDHKQALGAGRIEAIVTLPGRSETSGKVVWADGTSDDLPLVSADAALAQIQQTRPGECPDCVPLKVTGARLTTMTIATTRGMVTAPAWEYTLSGTAVRVARLAVDPSAIVRVTPPPWDDDHPHAGLAIESAATTTNGLELTVTFTGAPGPGSEPCGIDYGAEAAESDQAVVVIIIAYPHGGGGEACPSIGAERTATVELARPLGERAVLEVQQGLPVAITITG
ncbi:hypothetical protein [Micromonospora inositola]|uniref:Uncharacterized protein n=1 Tax=Micromonospora inositola TaxID=47865 RepID=A0A1C5H2C8_9ACTN|nr:hypothetical protein [Micromonospora inositola]SCG40073.1 hypothetical protein GA0070613_0719 [Micromonospora inositola]